MRPPAEEYVGGCRRHLGLELQRAVGLERVAREAQAVSLLAQPAVACEDDGPVALAPRVIRKHPVGPVEARRLLLIPAADFGRAAGVVQPPPVGRALDGRRVDDGREEGVHVRPVVHGAVDGVVHGDLRGREAHGLRHCEVLLLAVVDAVLHVNAQDHLDSLAVHLVEETLRVGEERAVESEAVPPVAAVAGRGGAVLVRAQVAHGVVDVVPRHLQP